MHAARRGSPYREKGPAVDTTHVALLAMVDIVAPSPKMIAKDAQEGFREIHSCLMTFNFSALRPPMHHFKEGGALCARYRATRRPVKPVAPYTHKSY